jgi:hypothetical protein
MEHPAIILILGAVLIFCYDAVSRLAYIYGRYVSRHGMMKEKNY